MTAPSVLDSALSATAHVLVADRLVDGLGHDGPGWIAVDDRRVVARGDGADPAPDYSSLPRRSAGWIVPGLADTHVHGARGVDFGEVGVDPEPAIRHHHIAGSTTVVASIATGSLDAMARRLRELAPLVAGERLAGIHLEGPWLSHARRGAHSPDLLRAPAPAEVETLLEAGSGAVRMVTLAPELPGALDSVARLVEAGVTVAIGHTDASADEVRRAIDAGASVVTHLFNGMPPLHHRQPGPVGVALADPSLTLELIADARHVDDIVVDAVMRCAGSRVSLVSDAMAATGLGDGAFSLAGSAIVVAEGVAMLEDGSSLAGSTTPLLGAAARLLSRSAPLEQIVAATVATPSRALGLDVPQLRIGDWADLIAVDAPTTLRVMRRGEWLTA